MAIQTYHRAVVARKNAGGGGAAGNASLGFDFTGEADNTLLTPTILGNRKIAGSGWTFSEVLGPSHGGGSADHTRIQSEPTSPSFHETYDVGGTDYDASESNVVEINMSGRTGEDGEWEKFRFTPPAAITEDVTFASLWYFGNPSGASESRIDHFIFNNSGNYQIMQQFNTAGAAGPGTIIPHTDGDGGGVYGTSYPITVGWHRVDGRWNVTDGTFELLVRNADTLAIVACAGWPTATTEINSIEFGDYLSSNGGISQMKGMLVAEGADATMPLGTCTVAAPTNVQCDQTTAGAFILSWQCKALKFRLRRSSNGGSSWTVLEAAIPERDCNPSGGVYSYTDAGGSDGDLYEVTAYIGTNASSSVNATNGKWYYNITVGSTTDDNVGDPTTILGQYFQPSVSGTLQKLAVYNATNTTVGGIKAALYNTSNDVLTSGTRSAVTSANSYAVVTMDAGESVSSSTAYRLRWLCSNGSDYTFRYQSTSGTFDYNFSGVYASFPPDPFSPDGSGTRSYAVGWYIES